MIWLSALQDARRRFLARSSASKFDTILARIGIDQGRFEAIYALLGLQRSLRILGVFARLCKAGGKLQYVDLLPRSWAYIQRNLEHPALEDLRAPMAAAYPAPDDELLQKLRAECGQHPTP
ncbi:MAG: hypothetical protein R3D78_08285 [Paracoccaceae bacterium]